MTFEPIAIIGQACLLPGALNPRELRDLVLAGRDVLTRVPENYWRVDPELVATRSANSVGDQTWCLKGGYVKGFGEAFDPRGFAISSAEIQRLDPLVHWILHAGREALKDAGDHGGPDLNRGAVLGNLSYPSHALSQFAESVWIEGQGPDFFRESARVPVADPRPDPINRFMSGLPAHILARALDLNRGAFALDAACASSLYAVKLACDQLHDRRADLMLAGGVNRADDLILHVGFCVLQAMSRTSRSRPFHRRADGLVPAEGAGFVVLKRLEDAVAAGDRIRGVIRAVGLSNDGRGQGLLAPSVEGQVRAIRQAYALSGLTPADINLVEAHATGTPVGDAVEIESMGRVFQGLRDIPMGSLKSNMGHGITMSGVAGLIKVLAAMEAGIRPATLHAEDPLEAMAGSPFRLLAESEPWNCRGPRRAAVNNFGFGGNNAHLIVEEWSGSVQRGRAELPPAPSRERVAIVAVGAVVADAGSAEAFARALFRGASGLQREPDGRPAGRARPFDLPLTGLRFPPADLDQALAQQLILYKATLEALDRVDRLPARRTGVLVGMGCDAEAARCAMSWRLPRYARDWAGDLAPSDLAAWVSRARDRIVPVRKAGAVVGAMPNITANRLCSQFDLGGPSYTVSSEELSGLRCLELAARALRHHELDAAVVGAVDLCCEPVHTAAAAAILGQDQQVPGDAAVVLILKRIEDARRDGDGIYAVLAPARSGEPDLILGRGAGRLDLTPLFGHAHAASGLVHVAAAALACRYGALPQGAGERARVWRDTRNPMCLSVSIQALGGEAAQVDLVQDDRDRSPSPDDEDLIGQRLGENGGLDQASGRRDLRTYAPHPPPVRLPLLVPDEEDPAVNGILRGLVSRHAHTAAIHRDFLARQDRLQQYFLQARQAALHALLAAALADPVEEGLVSMPDGEVATVLDSGGEILPLGSQAPGSRVDSPGDPSPASEVLAPRGPAFSREQLEVLASGKVSDVFGPFFNRQDGFRRQVRLPRSPLLLADRVTGIDAQPGSMGRGVIWTETDVTWDGWYLHDGFMPPGITVEAGQCDLVLISWLGVDFENRGERVYRLLGCDLVYYGSPPRAGDTLCYQIHVDGHARVGGVRIFFFHYDCRIDGELRLRVRNAQAGFFSDAELAASKGVLWTPETGEYAAGAPLDPPAMTCRRDAFTRRQVKAFSEGRVYECFGEGFEITRTHIRTPRIQSGRMLLLDRVARLDLGGGPWGRGYLRVENEIPADAWYLVCHFKNDPCMPGTLMSEACLQAMSFYLTAMGYTLDKDGWRFEPVPGEVYHIRCRGQVTPASRRLTYEVFVEEIHSGPYPTIYADILGTCDGRKILHIRRMGLRLVPDWPLDGWPHLLAGYTEKRPVARVGDLEFGYQSLLACAFGRPSDAFGDLGRPFDLGRHIARLPGPPYHFMSRVSRLEARMGAMKPGQTAEVEYDVPSGEWYFGANGYPVMPFCVLMETALQPCGWLAAFAGIPTSSENPLYFRNLDGTGTFAGEIRPGAGTIRTRTTLTRLSRVSGVILVNFDVQCFLHETTVFTMQTGFGFFSKEALDQQVGLPVSDGQRAWVDEPCDFRVDLTQGPERYCGGRLRLPGTMLLMLDRVTGYWPEGGTKGLGRLRAEKTVRMEEWFFKAHFFQDPVQPGSLGVEAMIQLLQFYMLHRGMGEGIEDPRFVPLALHHTVTWKYRGQVTPDRQRITVEMDIVARGRDDQGPYAVAEAWLWADDLRIFHVEDLKLHIVSGNRGSTRQAPDIAARLAKRTADEADEQPVKNRVADGIQVPVESVRLTEDGRAAICDHMPFNIFPLSKKNEVRTVAVDDSGLDLGRVFEYTRRLLGAGPWFGEDLVRGLCDLFVRRLIVEDPAALAAVRGRSLLFLGNHQVQVESILFPLLAQTLCGARVVTIANTTHRNGWIGPLGDRMFSRPGVADPGNIVYFNQTDRASMFDIIAGLKTAVAGEGISVFLHAEGRLGLGCRRPVRNLSSVFIDFALDARLPIVPVRFAGGLPVREMEAPLDFPVGYGKQDYYVGRPILPGRLEALPYAERRTLVIDAINHLGPSNAAEVPQVPNRAFAGKVSAWIAQTGVSEAKAVLFKALETSHHPPAGETRKLIQAASGRQKVFGGDPMGGWLRRLADWLFLP